MQTAQETAAAGYHAEALRAALLSLDAALLPPAALKRLRGEAARAAERMTGAVLAQVPAFLQSRNPQLRPELSGHCREIVSELLRLLAAGRAADLAFARDFAGRRAEQHFPLEAMLEAYHCGGRVLAAWLDEGSDAAAAAALAHIGREFAAALATVAAGAYATRARLLAQAAGDERARLLSLLLEGHDEADAQAAEMLRRAGYLSSRLSYCVVLAQPVDASEMRNPHRARRLAEAVENALKPTSARALAEMRDHRLVMVCSDVCRVSGWTEPQIDLAARMSRALALVGPAALIGVSNDALSTSQIPSAHRQAQIALERAHVGRRVVQFSDIGLRSLLLHLARDDVGRVLPAWATAFAHADAKARGALSATLRAYADHDMNVLKTADALLLHPNTVYARFERVATLTGLAPRSFHGLAELLLVADCLGR